MSAKKILFTALLIVNSFFSGMLFADFLVRGLNAVPASIHPHHFGGTPGAQVMKDVFEGLMIQNSKGNPIPSTAKNVNISKDQKTYIFTFDNGLKWSDGSPLTAEDFARSFKALADPKNKSSYRWYLRVANIKGVEEALKGDPNALSIEASKNKLTIHLSRPTPYFLQLLTFPSFLPVHKKNLLTSEPEELITNGPYKINKVTKDGGFSLIVNPYYKGKNKLDITKVDYRVVPKDSDEIALFEKKKIDITSNLLASHLAPLRKKHAGSIFENRLLSTYFLHVNPEKDILKGRDIRQAISLAIDRDQLVSLNFKDSKTKAACSFTAPHAHGYSPDPAYCKKLLNNHLRSQQALTYYLNSKVNKSDFSLTILTSKKYLGNQFINMMTQQIEDTLGIKVTLKILKWTDFLTALDKGDYDLAWFGWLAAYNDATAFLLPLMENKTFGPYHNKLYAQQMRLAAAQKNLVNRLKFYKNAETQLANNLPVIPVIHPSVFNLVSPQVGGYYTTNPEGWVHTKYLYKITNY